MWGGYRNTGEKRFPDNSVTDQTMPGMTGFDLAGEVLRIRPNLPIILCTGYSNLINEKAAKQIGIKAFIMKPVTKKQWPNHSCRKKNQTFHKSGICNKQHTSE